MTVFLLSSEHLEKGYFDNLNSTYRGTIRITGYSGGSVNGVCIWAKRKPEECFIHGSSNRLSQKIRRCPACVTTQKKRINHYGISIWAS